MKFLSELYIRGLNAFFSVTATRHRTLAGYVTEPRAAAFEANQSGFRGLLFATNVRELNEKQWEFFRYMVLEIVHSRMASNAVLATLNDPQYAQHAESYRSSLAKIGEEVQALRNRYFEAAVRTALGTPEFRREVELLEMQAKANNKTDAEIKQIVDNAVAEKRKATQETCRAHIKSSLGRFDPPDQIGRRLEASSSASPAPERPESTQTEGKDTPTELVDLDAAVAIDSFQNPSDNGDSVK